ncbi:virion protein [Murid herpesvirus 3]|uniref:Virion protein n=2 Tax=Murid betaherpesvirus 3 TaxID=2560603 RepID=A0A1P8VIQ7_9BETA|nr:virion protein [Murine roseolovirus]APZ76240.1 virion protein [Murid betaherpesvirus 3]AYH64707.1 virion protein [Murid herpesvirus 3]
MESLCFAWIPEEGKKALCHFIDNLEKFDNVDIEKYPIIFEMCLVVENNVTIRPKTVYNLLILWLNYHKQLIHYKPDHHDVWLDIVKLHNEIKDEIVTKIENPEILTPLFKNINNITDFQRMFPKIKASLLYLGHMLKWNNSNIPDNDYFVNISRDQFFDISNNLSKNASNVLSLKKYVLTDPWKYNGHDVTQLNRLLYYGYYVSTIESSWSILERKAVNNILALKNELASFFIGHTNFDKMYLLNILQTNIESDSAYKLLNLMNNEFSIITEGINGISNAIYNSYKNGLPVAEKFDNFNAGNASKLNPLPNIPQFQIEKVNPSHLPSISKNKYENQDISKKLISNDQSVKPLQSFVPYIYGSIPNVYHNQNVPNMLGTKSLQNIFPHTRYNYDPTAYPNQNIQFPILSEFQNTNLDLYRSTNEKNLSNNQRMESLKWNSENVPKLKSLQDYSLASEKSNSVKNSLQWEDKFKFNPSNGPFNDGFKSMPQSNQLLSGQNLDLPKYINDEENIKSKNDSLQWEDEFKFNANNGPFNENRSNSFIEAQLKNKDPSNGYRLNWNVSEHDPDSELPKDPILPEPDTNTENTNVRKENDTTGFKKRPQPSLLPMHLKNARNMEIVINDPTRGQVLHELNGKNELKPTSPKLEPFKPLSRANSITKKSPESLNLRLKSNSNPKLPTISYQYPPLPTADDSFDSAKNIEPVFPKFVGMNADSYSESESGSINGDPMAKNSKYGFSAFRTNDNPGPLLDFYELGNKFKEMGINKEPRTYETNASIDISEDEHTKQIREKIKKWHAELQQDPIIDEQKDERLHELRRRQEEIKNRENQMQETELLKQQMELRKKQQMEQELLMKNLKSDGSKKESLNGLRKSESIKQDENTLQIIQKSIPQNNMQKFPNYIKNIQDENALQPVQPNVSTKIEIPKKVQQANFLQDLITKTADLQSQIENLAKIYDNKETNESNLRSHDPLFTPKIKSIPMSETAKNIVINNEEKNINNEKPVLPEKKYMSPNTKFSNVPITKKKNQDTPENFKSEYRSFPYLKDMDNTNETTGASMPYDVYDLKDNSSISFDPKISDLSVKNMNTKSDIKIVPNESQMLPNSTISKLPVYSIRDSEKIPYIKNTDTNEIIVDKQPSSIYEHIFTQDDADESQHEDKTMDDKLLNIVKELKTNNSESVNIDNFTKRQPEKHDYLSSSDVEDDNSYDSVVYNSLPTSGPTRHLSNTPKDVNIMGGAPVDITKPLYTFNIPTFESKELSNSFSNRHTPFPNRIETLDLPDTNPLHDISPFILGNEEIKVDTGPAVKADIEPDTKSEHQIILQNTITDKNNSDDVNEKNTSSVNDVVVNGSEDDKSQLINLLVDNAKEETEDIDIS